MGSVLRLRKAADVREWKKRQVCGMKRFMGNLLRSKNAQRIVAAVLTLLSLLVLYKANVEMPFKMDDDWYGTNLVTGAPLSGIRDIWESQVWHFFHWGGRSMAHGQLQLVLLAGSAAADVMNVCVTVLLTALICVLADTKDWFHGLFTFGLLIILNANWSQTLLWQSGAANYLYMTSWILLFLLCYFRTLENPQKKELPGITFWIASLGLLAGWSNENMGPAVWIGTLLVIFFVWKEKKKIYPWMLVGNLFCLAGCGLLILAPGNFVRNTEAAGQTGGMGALWRAFLRGFSVANGLFYYLLDAFLLVAFFLFVYCFVLGKKLRRTDQLCLLMAVLSWGAMVLSPHYPDRAAFGTMVLCIVPVVHMFAQMQREKETLRLPAYGVVLFVWLGGMFPLCTYICQMIGWIK